jgi:chromosome segregation protein
VLKLKRIELFGFKSFSDKADIVVTESGVTGIVGPNGCGKSNVSDAIAWVLGEQSAKSLRGEKMEDVIFNGSRNRAPMGMAEVTITLTENGHVHHTNGNANGNGDGQILVHDKSNGHGNGNGNGNANGNGNGNGHAAPRDITVQRRLYRSGESVYMLDGKACRLRDIQDIFLGTGLGPNSYAIIEQGRVGQLLSSKPHDRRALIEEAAGITKFKAKRKLAESRLEAARQNLSRVNDILAEVDRQRNSLKRQAGKARRFIELRNRMREILSAVFSTRAEMLIDQQERVEIGLALMFGEGKRLEQDIEHLNTLVHQKRTETSVQERTLEENRERRSTVELEHEKNVQRGERLHDQIQALEERKTSLADEKKRTVEDVERNRAEREARAGQVATINLEKADVDQNIQATSAALKDMTERRNAEDRMVEQFRQQQFETIGREARLANEISSRKEAILRIGAQLDRLEREEIEARTKASALDSQLSAAREEHAGREAGYAELKNNLHEAEQTCARLKGEHADAVKGAAEAKSNEESIRHRLQTIGELAVQRAYSTESVQQFFNHVRSQDWKPLGIVADLIEVEREYEPIIEDFLRRELQYVVVEDRTQAERALAIVKNSSKGRLDCLVLNGSSQPEPPIAIEGAVPLANVIHFDRRVRNFSQYLRNAYLVDTVDQSWRLAERYPELSFIARTGEVVRGDLVSWGEHEAHGPLALKREIRDLDSKMGDAIRRTAAAEREVTRLEELVRESETRKSGLLHEVQEAEKAILNTDYQVRSLAAEFDRAHQLLKVTTAEIGRLTEERNQIAEAHREAEGELAQLAERNAAIEQGIEAHSRNSEKLTADIENVRRQFAGLQSQLAVLQERSSTVVREIEALSQQARQLEQRANYADLQIQQATEQQEETRASIRTLEETREELALERERLDGWILTATTALDELRQQLSDAESKWDESRALLDSWKDRHNALEIEKTQVDSDLKHLSETCFHELNETIESVCLKSFDTLPPGELEAREHEYKELRDKIDAIGAVNMMAVEEYQEAEERFAFLSTQRQDLLDSINDTTQAIDEIDFVCRRQFKEAFEAINAGFKESFVGLFGGGHGELRLLEGAEETEAGVEIVAQPPGKKLQNVLLLSGGEKALTALALLISLFRYKPSPFCVLDEVDAPLDDANVDRFAQVVRDMSSTTQFIVITHSKRTMETASALYGVTMEEPGISKIVSVRLN